MTPPPESVKIRINRDLFEHVMKHYAEPGRATIVWGEPNEEDCYTPALYVKAGPPSLSEQAMHILVSVLLLVCIVAVAALVLVLVSQSLSR